MYFCNVDYVADKLVAETTNMKTVWDIVYEIYDVEINATHFLDCTSMSRNTGETNRGFYNRLVGFVRQHLPKESKQVDRVRSPTERITFIGTS